MKTKINIISHTKRSKLALAITALLASPSYAQTDKVARADNRELEQIVVTAQQQEQLITEVPIALTAFSGENLDKMDITDLERVSSLTPGFLAQQQTDSSPSFIIRGVEAANAGAAAEPTISIFYNGIDSSRSRSATKELYDIERIEIVKGPQGTLFGRGASTGAIAIHTKKANTVESGGFLEAKLGNYNLTSLTGAYNAAVSDEFGIRVATSKRIRDGYAYNLGDPDNKLNDDDMFAGRISLRWLPHDDVNIDFIFDYQNDSDGDAMTKSIVLASPGGDTSPFSDAGQNTYDREQARRQSGYTLLADWDLNENWTVSSLIGYRQLWFENSFDVDGTTYDAYHVLAFDNQKAFSQELRFAYNTENATYTFGGSVYHDKSDSDTDFVVNEQYLLGGFPTNITPLTELPVTPNVSVPLNTGNVSSIITGNDRDSRSIFANLNYSITHDLVLDAGIRYTWDTAKLSESANPYTLDGTPSFVMPNGMFGGNSFGETYDSEADFDMLSPRFALTYHLNDTMNIYGGMSIGKRSGYPDINITNPTPTTVDQTTSTVGNETLISYEVGAKGQTKNIYFDMALYTYEYEDFQTMSLDITEGTANAGKAKAWGFEGVVSATLTEWLEGFVNYSYIDTKYVNFVDTLNGEQVDLSGNQFRLAPENTFSIGLDARQTMGGNWEVFANTRYSYRSDYFFNNDNLETERQEAFGLLDLNLGFENYSAGYKVELYVENALDKEWNRDIGNAGKLFGSTTAIRANPRFYGVRFRMDF